MSNNYYKSIGFPKYQNSDVVVGRVRQIDMPVNEGVKAYIDIDIKTTWELYEQMVTHYGNKKEDNMKIKKVKFNPPATIVFWNDGTKTVVKSENECYDAEKGLAMAIAKKALGNKGNYYNEFRKWLPDAPDCNTCKYCDNCCTENQCWDCDENYCNWERKDD